MGEAVQLATILIAMTCAFGGVPATLVVVLLRLARPERSLRAWRWLFRVALVLCVVAVAAGIWLIERFVAAEGMERLAVISMEFPFWLIFSIPAIAALATLRLHPAPVARSLRPCPDL